MDEKRIYEFYDYLLRVIGVQSRNLEYDYVYEVVEKEFADRFFPDDDERHYQFLSLFELHIGRLEKESLIVVKRKNEKPIELGLSEVGEHVCSLGGYLQYKREQESVHKRAEEEKRQRMQEESNERKWNNLNNKTQIILGIITSLSIVGGWLYSKDNNTLFTILVFISGCLLGYGVCNRIKSSTTISH